MQPVVVRPRRRGRPLRDHRRRTPLACGAARRPERDPGHRPRRQRPRGARARDHRERPARRPQPGRRSARLPAADRRTRLYPGRSRPDHRQEPQPCRQYAAAAEAAGPDARLAGRRTAVGRPCAHAGHRRGSGRAGPADRRGRAFGPPGRGAGAVAEFRGRAARRAPRPEKDPDTLRWRSCCRMRPG